MPTDISEECITSIFRVGNQPSKETACSVWLGIPRLILDPENGSDNFLRNIGSHTDYTAPYPRRWHLSIIWPRGCRHFIPYLFYILKLIGLNEAKLRFVRLEVFTVVTMKNIVFWDITTQFASHRK
jgi:hypothetical protein